MKTRNFLQKILFLTLGLMLWIPHTFSAETAPPFPKTAPKYANPAYYFKIFEKGTPQKMAKRMSEAIYVNPSDSTYAKITFTMVVGKDRGNFVITNKLYGDIIKKLWINYCEFWLDSTAMESAFAEMESFTCIACWPELLSKKIAEKLPDDLADFAPTFDGYASMAVNKIYETKEYVTYAIFMDANYHGTCGCTYRMFFYTLDKNTGEIIDIQNLIKEFDKEELNLRIGEQHTGASENPHDVFDYVGEADGCALVRNGLLFYYFPYHISGAWQENIVLKRR